VKHQTKPKVHKKTSNTYFVAVFESQHKLSQEILKATKTFPQRIPISKKVSYACGGLTFRGLVFRLGFPLLAWLSSKLFGFWELPTTIYSHRTKMCSHLHIFYFKTNLTCSHHMSRIYPLQYSPTVPITSNDNNHEDLYFYFLILMVFGFDHTPSSRSCSWRTSH
jgi:hypothetical protein